mmetsp:Transcript_23160/g.67527  ORF Transcript_23160/g.67527 Transcript_23160/m.67527 type:complete len:247 (+) Transcript_23160:451-1191(+)
MAPVRNVGHASHGRNVCNGITKCSGIEHLRILANEVPCKESSMGTADDPNFTSRRRPIELLLREMCHLHDIVDVESPDVPRQQIQRGLAKPDGSAVVHVQNATARGLCEEGIGWNVRRGCCRVRPSVRHDDESARTRGGEQDAFDDAPSSGAGLLSQDFPCDALQQLLWFAEFRRCGLTGRGRHHHHVAKVWNCLPLEGAVIPRADAHTTGVDRRAVVDNTAVGLVTTLPNTEHPEGCIGWQLGVL